LFHEKLVLKMITSKAIRTGEQIVGPLSCSLLSRLTNTQKFNTYGDLPNSELLRRHGHVDLLPLPQGMGEGNPGDVVEIRADLVVNAISCAHSTGDDWYKERIDWWLEEGGDEYVLDNF